MIIDGLEYPDDPEEGEDMPYISIRHEKSVYYREVGKPEILLFREINHYNIEYPGDVLWDAVGRAFTEIN